MQFLFKVTAVYNKIPTMYSVHQINGVEYYVEPADKQGRGFTLKKCARTWIATGWCTEMQALEIGEFIDRLKSNGQV